MTAEQIAALRKRLAEPDIYESEQVVGAAEVLALLDEREALLAALKHLRDRVQMRSDGDWCRGEMDACHGEHAPCGDAVALSGAGAAIAKAEAP